MSDSVGRELTPGHRVVAASMVLDQPYTCPHCKSTNVIVHGYFNRAFEQPYVEGVPTKDALVLGEQAVKDITGMECSNCKIYTIIEDDEKFEREGMIFDLQTQVAMLQGKVGLPPVKEWRN